MIGFWVPFVAGYRARHCGWMLAGMGVIAFALFADIFSTVEESNRFGGMFLLLSWILNGGREARAVDQWRAVGAHQHPLTVFESALQLRFGLVELHDGAGRRRGVSGVIYRAYPEDWGTNPARQRVFGVACDPDTSLRMIVRAGCDDHRMPEGPDERPTWDSQARLDAELSRRTPARSRVRTGPGAAVPRGWAPDVVTEDGLRALVRKIDSAPPTFLRAQALLAGLPELKDAGYSGVEEGLALAVALGAWVTGPAAAAWVGWSMLGSPPALVGWLVLLCAVITVAVFAALMVVPDRGRQQLLIDPDASRIARVLPPPGAGGRLFVRVRRDGGDTAVSLIHLSLRPSPASEERFEWRTVADQRFGRGEELLAEDCVVTWSEMAAVHAHLDRRGAAAADIAAALARRLAR